MQALTTDGVVVDNIGGGYFVAAAEVRALSEREHGPQVVGNLDPVGPEDTVEVGAPVPVPGILIDVPVRGWASRRVSSTRVVVVLLGTTALAGAMFAVVLPSGSMYMQMAGFFLLFNALMFAFRRGAKSRRARLRKTLEAEPDADVGRQAKRVFDSAGKLAGDSPFRELTKFLMERGRAGTTLRLCPEDLASPIEPIAVPFEPRPIDECESSFEALQSVSAGEDLSGGAAQPAGAGGSATDNSAGRMAKNIMFKGGWAFFVIYCVFLAKAAWRAYRIGEVTLELLLWAALFCLWLIVPIGGLAFRGRQWFLVPGGLIVRKGHWWSGRWHVHVFDRRDCVLCVYRWGRKIWWATISDAGRRETFMGTRREVETLLRAWLGPLPPPPAEGLGDLL